MEHRLIRGGEQYLPFARSCVAKLKKLGLPYANQSFEVDGVSIKVRIEPGHEYIRIEGGGVPIFMDSGVVDIGFFSQTPYAKGTLHSSENNAAYEIGFTGTKVRNDVVLGERVWKTNPAILSQGQLSGDVIYSAVAAKGHVPPDGLTARSFAPKMNEVVSDPVSVPRVWSPEVDDASLLRKKQAAALCPASIFTGKCRLYVQSMYGQHLYFYPKDGDSRPSHTPEVVPPTSSGAAPALLVDAYVSQDDRKENGTLNSYPQVLITTSTGVYLDSTTGKHWLINLVGSSVVFTPLVGTLEHLRRYLRAQSFAGVERDHLEAYILASCLPDVKNAVTVLVADIPYSFSLGYGWHWSWSTGFADVVTLSAKVYNEGMGWTAETEGQYYVQVSRHSRLTITPPTETTGWAAEVSVIESDIEWNLYRYFWCILEPSWAEGGFFKSTLPVPLIRSKIFNADVPIYAFYKRDELQVARLNISISYPEPGVLTSSNNSLIYNPNPTPFFRDLFSFGFDADFTEKTGGSTNVDGGRIVTVTFSCGGYTAPRSVFNLHTGGWRTDVTAKHTTGGRDAGQLNFDFTNARTGALPPGEIGIPPVVTVEGTYATMAYDIVSGVVDESTYGRSVYVVPRGDSEAIYMRTDEVFDRRGTENDIWHMSSGAFAGWSRPVTVTMTSEDVLDENGQVRWTVWSWTYVDDKPPSDDDLILRGAEAYTSPYGGIVGTEQGQDTSEYRYTQTMKLLCGGAAIDVDFPDIYEAHDETVEFIGAYTFNALSGTSVTNPTVFAPGRSAPIGFNANITNPAIVGWL